MRLSNFIYLSTLLSVALAFKSYAGYQVLSTPPLDEKSLEKIASLYRSDEFDFWSRPRVGRGVHIMSPPHKVAALKSELSSFNLEPTVLIPDVGITIAKERAEIEAIKRKEKRIQGRAPILDRYLEFDEIQAYLDEVAAAYPEIVTIETIGSSYEGRPLRVLKISNGPGKTGIWFDSAVHAREWAGPPTALYSISQLTDNLAENQALLDNNDFYFLPMANPDGYVYSWTDDRLWRKTRSINEGSNCIGTDPNRNYDYAWGGAGDGPCSETYPGSMPFSEPETKAVADYLTANPNITFYVAIHSWGQYLLFPWGDTSELPPTVDDLRGVGIAATDALTAIHGTRYQVGSTYNILYSAYGLAEDWAYDTLGIPLSYTIELPGGGISGFTPPASDIEPVTQETWEAYKVFAQNIPTSRFTRKPSHK